MWPNLVDRAHLYTLRPSARLSPCTRSGQEYKTRKLLLREDRCVSVFCGIPARSLQDFLARGHQFEFVRFVRFVCLLFVISDLFFLACPQGTATAIILQEDEYTLRTFSLIIDLHKQTVALNLKLVYSHASISPHPPPHQCDTRRADGPRSVWSDYHPVPD